MAISGRKNAKIQAIRAGVPSPHFSLIFLTFASSPPQTPATQATGYTEDANENFKVGEGKDGYGGGEYEIN